MRPEPMTDPIATQADSNPESVALIDVETDRTWTYEEYDAHVESTARRLAGSGVESDDRVAVLSETHPSVAHVFFACWRLGAVFVPLNARLSVPELQTQLDAVSPALLLCSTDEVDAATTASGKTETETETELLDAFTDTPVVDDIESRTAAELGSQHQCDPRDVAYLFTSGTTGEPKAVRLTTQNFEAAAAAHRDRLGVAPEERWLCPLSSYHMGGLAILLRSAFYGTTAVLQRTTSGFDPAATRDALADYDCTAVSVVPVMLRRLLDDGALPDSLRFVLCGGAPTPPQLVERAASRDVPVCPSYGMTETTSQVATPTPEEAAAHPETVGRPLQDVEVRLVDDAGDEVSTGELGEIVVSGPTVTPGYLHGGGEFGPREFHTGDIARMDNEGRLTVLNRREDRILTGGENVHPGEVASVLADHPSVDSVAVLGMPDPEWGEQVAALVERSAESGIEQLGTEELREFARERLAGYKVPKTIAFTDEIPRTASGTVDRAAAREELRRLTDL